MPFLVNSPHLWRVWIAGARANLVRDLEFRANFIFGIIRQILWLGIFVFMIEVIFQNVSTLSGWQKHEVLIILALSRLIEGLINTLFSQNILELPRLIQTGAFDFHLTKPLSAQFYTAFRNLTIHNVGNVLAGMALLGYAVSLPEVTVSLTSWLLFIFFAVIGITLFYCLLIIVSSLAFFLERLEALWGFMALFSEPLTVPFDIFPRLPRVALTYFIPIAFVVYVPAQSLTNRLSGWQLPFAIGITLLFLLLANLAWRAGLRRYSSASS